jgi:KipI family sensor histidine kinase inhibitor
MIRATDQGGGRLRVEIEPLGDRAWLAHFETEREAARWVRTVRRRGIPGLVEVVLAYRSAAVFADPDACDLDALGDALAALEPDRQIEPEGKVLAIPVLYDGADLEPVAGRLGLNAGDIVALHSGSTYEVFAIGFLQGFPYAGYLTDRLAGLARRDDPRRSVPAGSVAIAGRQTGIYPRESPGGWHLLGRTPLSIADPDEGYFPIRAGDRIRFVPIDRDEFEARRDERL